MVLAVEAKDRQLHLHDLQGKLPAIRERGIGEALFLVRGGIAGDERGQIDETIDRQFPTGHNVYIADFESLLHSCLILFGERGAGNSSARSGKRLMTKALILSIVEGGHRSWGQFDHLHVRCF